MLMIDLVLNIDSLHLKDGESVDDVINHIQERFEMGFEPTYEILHEEMI